MANLKDLMMPVQRPEGALAGNWRGSAGSAASGSAVTAGDESFEQGFRETLEALADMRPSARGNAAVRRNDLKAILKMMPEMKSKNAADGIPISSAEYNALRADVRSIFTILQEISSQLGANAKNSPANNSNKN